MMFTLFHLKFVKAEEDTQVQTIAERIVQYAQLCMHNKKRVSPFERAAAREGMYFRGGVSPAQFVSLYIAKFMSLESR
jgi:hypothetical protein